MYEVNWQTQDFANDWPTTGQPFYLSYGDNTGYGLHGDYLFGWTGDALQRAMDGHCANDRCAPLQRQADQTAVQCTKGQSVKEDIGDDCKSIKPP